jgi:hypothetical protein
MVRGSARFLGYRKGAGSVDDWLGVRGFWIDDNDYCEIVAVVDEGAGVYEFKVVDPTPGDLIEHYPWIGFTEDFIPEC